MSHIVLFHSGLGLRAHLHQWKAALERGGHTVTLPDLYDGEVFDDLDAGVRKRDAVGIDELSRRAQAAVAELPHELVYAGFSLGAASAQALALTRPGAAGLIMMHAALPLAAFGQQAWPKGLLAQLHTSERDPWVDRTVVKGLVGAAGSALEHYDYAGDKHLFADEDYRDYDESMAVSLFRRVTAFVGRVHR